MATATTYRIRYYEETGEVAERRIEPLRLVASRCGAMIGVRAICLDRGRRRETFTFAGMFGVWGDELVDDPREEFESLGLPVEFERKDGWRPRPVLPQDRPTNSY